ncbi:N/A [soil metagenome]
MFNDASIEALFTRRSHNPSYFEVQAALDPEHPLLDFCVPVNPYFPPAEMTRRIQANLADILKFYPDYSLSHQSAIAAFTGLPDANIVPANGSTEIITQLCSGLKGALVTPVPTFGRWTDLPLEAGMKVRFIERKAENGFHVSVDTMVDAVAATKAHAAVICNPDNPTGASMRPSEVAQLVRRLAHIPLIVIDESFIDFSDIESASHLAVDSPNVVIVKSMGKALGWHGIRLGYAVANAQLAEELRNALPYWNINGLASFVLKNIGDFKDLYAASFRRIARDRRYMIERLSSVEGIDVYPSATNFVYCKLHAAGSGQALRTRLLRDFGVLIRECGNKIGSTSDHLRLAVLPRDSVDRLVAAMKHCIPVD